jgi:hypothetical protein
MKHSTPQIPAERPSPRRRHVKALTRALAAFGLICLANATAAHAQGDLTLTIAGKEEFVATAEQMNCRPKRGRGIDVTDMPVSAFRRADGKVILLAGNRFNWFLEGPDVDKVRRTSCNQILESAENSDPSQYRDKEWVTSLYSKDGKYVLGFVHNEYHGEDHGQRECVIRSASDRVCWYASSTMIESRDGGHSFSRPPMPASVLISLPYEYKPGMRRGGVSLPKVVGNPADGKVYVFASYADRNTGARIGQCVFRGTGTQLGGWEAWDGSQFKRFDSNPYACDGTCTGNRTTCKQVIDDNIFSVRYVPAKRMYVALGFRRNQVIYRVSKDLVNWGERKVLMEAPAFQQWQPGDGAGPQWYYSLLDPSSSSRNFDTLESRPYLYLTRFRVAGGKITNSRRDLMRVPLRID